MVCVSVRTRAICVCECGHKCVCVPVCTYVVFVWCVWMCVCVCACGAHACAKNIIHNLATTNMRLLFMAVCTHDGCALFIPAMFECHYSIG